MALRSHQLNIRINIKTNEMNYLDIISQIFIKTVNLRNVFNALFIQIYWY